MPKYTVQNGSAIALVGGNRVTLKVGDEVELTKAQAEKMDREGFYLCPSAEFSKRKLEAEKKPKAPTPPKDEVDEEEELDEEELEQLTKPTK